MTQTKARPKVRKGPSGKPLNTKPARPAPGERLFRLPDGSRSVQSPWVWRGFTFMSLVAFGLFLSFVTGNHPMLAAAWGFITVGWFSIAMWLWRKHVRDDNEWYARQRAKRSA